MVLNELLIIWHQILIIIIAESSTKHAFIKVCWLLWSWSHGMAEKTGYSRCCNWAMVWSSAEVAVPGKYLHRVRRYPSAVTRRFKAVWHAQQEFQGFFKCLIDNDIIYFKYEACKSIMFSMVRYSTYLPKDELD